MTRRMMDTFFINNGAGNVLATRHFEGSNICSSTVMSSTLQNQRAYARPRAEVGGGRTSPAAVTAARNIPA